MHVLLTILALLIVLGVVVFVHELGHFLAARWAGVRVDTFSIGFGPAIVKWHDKRGTLWKIACLPLGGYVSIYGQEDMFNRKKYAELPADKRVGHYLSAPAWKQFIIIGAGVFMNFLLAWIIYTSLFMFQPRLVANSQLPVIGQVIQESVAFNAGVKPGDTIVRIDDEKISNWGEVILAKELASNRDADVLIVRGDELVNVKLAPAERWGMVADGARRADPKPQGLFRAMYSGARKTYYHRRTFVETVGVIHHDCPVFRPGNGRWIFQPVGVNCVAVCEFRRAEFVAAAGAGWWIPVNFDYRRDNPSQIAGARYGNRHYVWLGFDSGTVYINNVE